MQEWARFRAGLGGWTMVRGPLLGLVLCTVLAGCGGGGGSTPAPPPPPQATALPDSVTITAPASSESANAVKFANSASPLPGYSYRWDFGDGTQSTEAAPSHSFAKGGDFEVVLTLSNEAGLKREARSTVSITNIANVQGLTCSGASSTGWCVQSPRRAGALADSFLLDANLGWAVTSAGDIFKTADGGVSWETQTPPVKGNLNLVTFFDANVGWVLGENSLALRTVDGGQTWAEVRVQAGVANAAGSFQVVSGSVAYFRPDAARTEAYVSADGGASWRKLSPAPTAVTQGPVAWWLKDGGIERTADAGATRKTVLDFAQAGLAVSPGETQLLVHPAGLAAAVVTKERINDAQGQLLAIRTTFSTTADGGATWRHQRADCRTTAAYCFAVRPSTISADAQTLLGFSEAPLLRSVDAGKTWAEVPDVEPRFWYVRWIDRDTLALDLQQNPSTVNLSRDGGKTFAKFQVPAGVGTNFGKLQVQPGSGSLTYVHNGNLWLGTSDGSAWERRFWSVGTGVDDIYFFQQPPIVAMRDARRGFVIDTFGVVKETSDGGRTLKPVAPGVLRSALRIQFIDDKVGWFSTYDYTRQVSTIYRTQDGGLTWNTMSTGLGYAADFCFETDKTGWVRTPNERGYTFQVTQDGGVTWQDLPVPGGTYDLRRTASGGWVASGQRGMLATSQNNGTSWTVAPAATVETLATLAFSDPSTLWALGSSALLKSTDSGATWSPVALPCASTAAKDIAFASSKVGWAVCAGAIMATTDGGATWRAQTFPDIPRSPAKVFVSDSKTAWISGAWNSLLATGSGGQ